jgi:hypothetical protein
VKLPKMTAELAIGPAFGSYAMSAPRDERMALSPMAVTRAQGTAQERLRLADQKRGGAPSPCPDGTHACWGADGTAQELDYICCQPHQECGIDPASGDPTCRLRVARQLFGQKGLGGAYGPLGYLENLLT